MKSISPISHEAMNAESLSKSSSSTSSSTSSSFISGSGRGTEGTVYDGDDETDPCDLSVDTGLYPIPDELHRLWNFAGEEKITNCIPQSPPNGINGCAEESAHREDGRLGADHLSTETESTSLDDVPSMVLDERRPLAYRKRFCCFSYSSRSSL